LEHIFINFQKKTELESGDFEFMANYNNLTTITNDAEFDLGVILKMCEKASQDIDKITEIKYSLEILKDISKTEPKKENVWADLTSTVLKNTKKDYNRFKQLFKELKDKIAERIFKDLNNTYNEFCGHIFQILDARPSFRDPILLLLQKNETIMQFPQKIKKLVEEIRKEKELKDVNLKLLEDSFKYISKILDQSEQKDSDLFLCVNGWNQFIEKT